MCNVHMIGCALLWMAGVAASVQDRGNLVDAVRHGRTDEVQSLLARGANPNACAPDLVTPLIAATELGQVDTIALLLEKGAKIDGTCTGEWTPLMHAARRGNLAMVQLLVVRALIRHGVDLNAVNKEGETALGIAKRNGSYDIFDALRAAGAK